MNGPAMTGKQPGEIVVDGLRETPVTIHAKTGKVTVPGLVHDRCPGLAITMHPFGVFAVTHIQSGVKLCRTYERAATALLAMSWWALIAESEEKSWNRMNAEDAAAMINAAKDKPVPFGECTSTCEGVTRKMTVGEWFRHQKVPGFDEFPWEEKNPYELALDNLSTIKPKAAAEGSPGQTPAPAAAIANFEPMTGTPVAYVDPQALTNFANGTASKEWMWAKPDAGLVPVVLKTPGEPPVAKVTVSEASGGYTGAYVGIEWLDKDKVNEGDHLYRGQPHVALSQGLINDTVLSAFEEVVASYGAEGWPEDVHASDILTKHLRSILEDAPDASSVSQGLFIPSDRYKVPNLRSGQVVVCLVDGEQEQLEFCQAEDGEYWWLDLNGQPAAPSHYSLWSIPVPDAVLQSRRGSASKDHER